MKYKLTPVEENNGLFLKREDLFFPFTDCNLNGGKVRQCFELIRQNADKIRENHNGLVGTASSVHSPQGYIVARCAAQFGFKSFMAISSDVNTAISKHRPVQLAHSLGDVRRIAKMGYSTVMNARLKELQKKWHNYIVNFGMDADSVIAPIARQCENLPDDLDILVIPGGSCISFAAILRGLRYYNKKVKRIVCVQISGIDRRKRINELANVTSDKYEYIQDKRYPYAKHINLEWNGVDLDKIYEAKCFEWMLKNIDYKNNKTLFWIVSNFNEFR